MCTLFKRVTKCSITKCIVEYICLHLESSVGKDHSLGF